MAVVSIVIAILLIVLGCVAYFPHPVSITALIPTFFGVAFLVLGLIALKESLRKHAMHLAAVLGLIGFAFPAFRAAPKLLEGDFSRGVQVQSAMAVICLAFLLLCINSFVQARLLRKQAAGGDSSVA